MRRLFTTVGWIIWSLMLLGFLGLPVLDRNFWYLLLPLSAVSIWVALALIRKRRAKGPRQRLFDGTEEEAVGKLVRSVWRFPRSYFVVREPGHAELVESEQESHCFVRLSCDCAVIGRKVVFDHAHTFEGSLREVTNPRETARIVRRIEVARMAPLRAGTWGEG
jgi:hypothetical protein